MYTSEKRRVTRRLVKALLSNIAHGAAAIALAACARSSARPAPAAANISEGWYAGGATCAGPQLQVRAYDHDFLILRQAACTNYEKPFLYLIFGSERALLLDTGAGKIDLVTPIDSLLRAHGTRDLVVAHSHAHGDHVAGDTLIAKRANTRVVGRDTGAVRSFFNIARWPQDSGTIDLGGRVLDVLPIPGHQPASIALYDRRTGILLTGDTFYPGRLYVRDTAAFAVSVARLASFVRTHRVTHILGTHIENSSTPFVDYPVGTVDQPHEHGLDLTAANLFELDSVVQSMRGRMTRAIRRDFTVWPQVP
jgi:glyoxylase-like metal-dependent hydrolase (beta-lactamase superfamily II)